MTQYEYMYRYTPTLHPLIAFDNNYCNTFFHDPKTVSDLQESSCFVLCLQPPARILQLPLNINDLLFLFEKKERRKQGYCAEGGTNTWSGCCHSSDRGYSKASMPCLMSRWAPRMEWLDWTSSGHVLVGRPSTRQVNIIPKVKHLNIFIHGWGCASPRTRFKSSVCWLYSASFSKDLFSCISFSSKCWTFGPQQNLWRSLLSFFLLGLMLCMRLNI